MLSNPEKRKKYDEYGEHWKHADEYEAQRREYEARNNSYGGFNYPKYCNIIYNGKKERGKQKNRRGN